MTHKILKFIFLILCSALSAAQTEPQLKIGGALRFNYTLSSWKTGQLERTGDFAYDVFFLTTAVSHGKLEMNAEYRFYSHAFGGGMLKHGYITYRLKDNENINFGLTRVPFGNSPYNSNSWFFSLAYYAGLEDDYDMGISYHRENKNFLLEAGFFKNSEELISGSFSDISGRRYAYDISSISSLSGTGSIYRNKEINHGVARIILKKENERFLLKFGLSALGGGIYNLDTKKTGVRLAAACHADISLGSLHFKAQGIRYHSSPVYPQDQSENFIAMTAYNAAYIMASEGWILTAGAAWTLPFRHEYVSNITLYNDFGVLYKDPVSCDKTVMNVSGLMVVVSNIYIYADLATGRNHPWIGGDWRHSMAEGDPDADLETRFNVNMGYYF